MGGEGERSAPIVPTEKWEPLGRKQYGADSGDPQKDEKSSRGGGEQMRHSVT